MIDPFTCLAVAIFMEAQGEPTSGKEAVAEVIMARVDDSKFPDTVCGVITEKKRHYQFSFYRKDFSWVIETKNIFDEKAWSDSQVVAQKALDGETNNRTKGSLYYTRTEIQRVWMKNLTRVAVIGNHKFMKRKNK